MNEYQKPYEALPEALPAYQLCKCVFKCVEYILPEIEYIYKLSPVLNWASKTATTKLPA